MHKINSIVLFIGIVLLLGSCSTSKIVTSLPVKQLTEQEQFNFTYNFFEANKHQLNENYDLAISIYSECLKIDNTSSAVYYNLAKIYIIKNDFKVAENYISSALNYNNENTDYLYLAGIIYQKNNKIELAENIFKQLISIDNTNIEYYINLADAYLQSNDLKKAISIYDNIDNKFGISESIVLQKVKIYVALHKPNDALVELQKLAKANNSDVYYLRLIPDFYLQMNNIDLAIVEYNKILQSFPKDGFCNIGLAECYQKQGDINKALVEIRKAFESDELPSDVKISLFINLYKNSTEDKNIQPILFDFTKVLVNKYPDNADINTIYADFLLRNNDLENARIVLRKVVKERKDKYKIWEQLILIENQLLCWDTMYIECKEALVYFPNQSFLYFFMGFSSYQLKKYDEALENFEFGYKLITKTDPLRSDYLSFMGELYHKKGENKKAYSFYDSILVQDKENLMVLNNYAYYLSEDKVDLERAKKMSVITVEKEPLNATYLDTYGWILFCLGDYSGAQKYLEKAIIYDKTKSAVIVEHYGDVLYHLNDKENAIRYWNIAKSYGEGSKFLDEKIEKGIYLE